jgi:lipid-A-disaccharide synthase
VVPEFVQDDCTVDKLVGALGEVLSDTPMRRRQTDAFARIDGIMSTGSQSPSVRAADIVLGMLRKSRRAS